MQALIEGDTGQAPESEDYTAYYDTLYTAVEMVAAVLLGRLTWACMYRSPRIIDTLARAVNGARNRLNAIKEKRCIKTIHADGSFTMSTVHHGRVVKVWQPGPKRGPQRIRVIYDADGKDATHALTPYMGSNRTVMDLRYLASDTAHAPVLGTFTHPLTVHLYSVHPVYDDSDDESDGDEWDITALISRKTLERV